MQKKGAQMGPPFQECPRVGRARWRTGTHRVAPEWFTSYRTASASRDGDAGVGGGEGRVEASERKVDTGNHEGG